MKTFTTCLWFDNNAMEAVNFYTSIFPDSSIGDISYYDENNPHGKTGDVMSIYFKLNNSDFLAINGGNEFYFTPAVSFVIYCKNQEEIDFYYNKMSVNSEAEICGWIEDKYGISWQIVPENMEKYIKSNDLNKKSNFMKSLLSMKRIDMNELENAYNS